MYPNTPTLSDGRSEASFSGSRYGRRGVDMSKYRTQLCRNYSMGQYCSFGSRCAFSHEEPVGGACTRMDDMDFAQPPPPPPPYSVAMREDVALPPTYTSRFRYDPYGLHGMVFEY
ncbi:putative Zinc finger C x8 C x5 C x3 H type (and similar) [Trypanosoma vivax]|uniref:Zinc finger protein n=1 Tax=Trypanosoma vivax (strain Y486) TaxID=1055687 RepID=G0TX18_TRYVY|nr:zinc finger protein [Trypanosoma vivax]KAH8614179.1 putative Zinc finger C x8 C x5 C x3 H type (and similar) [Trypanosoma vivax]CCC48507.1 zinc finger protein [Trypanosoma vivax Y486]